MADLFQFRIVFVGEQSIQTIALIDILCLHFSECELEFHSGGFDDFHVQNNDSQVLLIDAFAVPRDKLLFILGKVAESDVEITVAVLNVNRDEFLDELIAWPEVRGIFYHDTRQEHLIKGVQAIVDGDVWFSRDLMSRYLSRNRVRVEGVSAPSQSVLTDKESLILSYVVTGLSNKEIANRLDISDGTVKTHLYNIFKKIGVKNRVQAANWLQSIPAHHDILFCQS